MSRNPTNTAGIYRMEGKRGVTWRAVISAGRDPATGKRRQIVKTFREYEDAFAWRLKTLSQIMDGTYHEPSSQTLGEYLTAWLERRQDIAPKTRDTYSRALRNHIIPRLGAVALGDLRPSHIQDLYDHYAGTSIPFTLHTVLKPALSRARRLGLTAVDVMDGVQQTGKRHIRTDETPAVWTAEQLERFLNEARAERLYPLFVLLAATGMRSGEALALTWEQVDLAAGEVRVVHTKTPAGRRRVTIDPDTIAVLRLHWREQMSRRELLGPNWHDTGLVFERGDGRPLHRAVLHATMARVVKRAGLPKLSPHGLRHTHASLLLQAGRPPHYVQRRLGHANITLTLGTYAHVIPQTDRADAEAFAAMLRVARERREQGASAGDDEEAV